jgi:cation diffusion facilitator CzcD-associated flavoprotein CzcO
VFQRTPSSIDVRNNHPIDPDWFAELEPGWQKRWQTNFTILQTGGFTDEDLVKDGWTDISQRIRDRVVVELGREGAELTPELIQQAFEASDDEKMSEIRARVDRVVADATTAEHLKPWYRQLCKRPCFHDEYLEAFNEPGTHLVDTDGQGVERIDETGVWAGGRHYELDVLVFASGFEFGADVTRRAGFETVGRGGETLSDHWAEGMRTLHGIHVHGFPNLFVVGITQAANLISNITHNLSEAGATVAAVVGHAEELARAGDTAVEVEVTAEAEAAWLDRLDRSTGMFGNLDCTPGYYNNEGQAFSERDRLNGARFADGPVAYFDHIDRWRRSGDFDGLEFRPR